MPLPTTPEWRDAIQAQFRRQGSLSVRLSLERPEARQSASVTTSPTLPWYRKEALLDGYTAEAAPMVTLEHNRWALTGLFKCPTEDPAESFATRTWGSRDLLLSQPIDIVVHFSMLVDLPGLQITWDTETDSYPTDIELIFSDSSTLIFSNLDTVVQSFEFEVFSITQLTIRIHAWKHPRWRARGCELFFGTIVDYPEELIQSAESKSELSLLAGQLPSIGTTVTFNNFENEFDPLGAYGYAKYVYLRLPIETQWSFEIAQGVVQSLPPQKGFLTKIDAPTDEPIFRYQIGTRLDFLNATFTQDPFTGSPRSLGAIATQILENVDLLVRGEEADPWKLDPALFNMFSTAPIPPDAANSLLQLVANAAGQILDVDTLTGYISIHPLLPLTEKRALTRSTTFGEPEIAVEEQILSIRVAVSQYAQETATPVEVFNGAFELTGTQTLELRYNGEDPVGGVSDTVTYGTVLTKVFYSQYALLTVQPTGVQPVRIVLRGIRYKKSVAIYETYRNSQIDRGLEILVENPFVTDKSFLQNVTQLVLTVLDGRQSISQQYQGIPEILASDPVSVVTNYGETFGYVTSNSLQFNGGWSGTLKWKVLQIEPLMTLFDFESLQPPVTQTLRLMEKLYGTPP